MNINEIKETLPDVDVKFNGQIFNGLVRGRKNEFATVFIPDCDRSFEFSWNAIQRFHNGEIRYLKA